MDGNKNSNTDYASEKQEHQFIIEDHSTCCLCGTKLVFQHEIDFLTLRVKEDADCPACHIRLKTQEHGLQ